LEAANQNSTKTEMMYEAVLTYEKLSEYCTALLQWPNRIPDRRTNLQDDRDFRRDDYSNGCKRRQIQRDGSYITAGTILYYSIQV